METSSTSKHAIRCDLDDPTYARSAGEPIVAGKRLSPPSRTNPPSPSANSQAFDASHDRAASLARPAAIAVSRRFVLSPERRPPARAIPRETTMRQTIEIAEGSCATSDGNDVSGAPGSFTGNSDRSEGPARIRLLRSASQ